MTIRAVALVSLMACAIPVVTASEAQAQSCGELWYRRNSLYKQAGYCFKTASAIRTFGNAGCAYDSEYDVPLSPRQRGIVRAIQEQERDLGCPR
jgi:YARHG domain